MGLSATVSTGSATVSSRICGLGFSSWTTAGLQRTASRFLSRLALVRFYSIACVSARCGLFADVVNGGGSNSGGSLVFARGGASTLRPSTEGFAWFFLFFSFLFSSWLHRAKASECRISLSVWRFDRRSLCVGSLRLFGVFCSGTPVERRLPALPLGYAWAAFRLAAGAASSDSFVCRALDSVVEAPGLGVFLRGR